MSCSRWPRSATIASASNLRVTRSASVLRLGRTVMMSPGSAPSSGIETGVLKTSRCT